MEDEMADHPGDQALAQFVERRLSGAAREEIETHLAGCDRCLEVVLAAREPNHSRVWIRWTLAAAAAVVGAAAVYLLIPRKAAIDLEEFVRAHASRASTSAGWKVTLDAWSDLETVPPRSLDPEEQAMLVRTMQGRPWVAEGLSAAGQGFVRRAIESRIQLSAVRPAATGSTEEIERQAGAIEAMAGSGELHPWAMSRFVEFCEGVIARADDREYRALGGGSIPRDEFVRRLRRWVDR
jgi:hypothetical protein